MLELSTLIFVIIGIALFPFGLEAILTALIVSSVLQALAFINIGDSPITAYYFFGPLFIVRGLLDLLWKKPVITWTPGRNAPIISLSLFVFLSIFGVFVLPNMFYGLLVYSPKLGIDDQVNNMTRLALDSTNLNQAAQLLVNALIVLIIWLEPISTRVVVRAIFFAWGIAIFFALWQLLANTTGFYFPEEYLYTAEGWSLGNDQFIGSFARVNSTFVEPSSFATYLTGMYGFLLVLWIKRPSWTLLSCVLLTVFAMLITVSSTAYLSLFMILIIILLGLGFVPLLKSGWVDKSVAMIFLTLIVIACLLLMLWLGSEQVRELIDVVLLQKSDGDSFGVRFDADIQSVQILWNTYGLGVGLGSNRPSSFLLFLLSNVGILGFLLFTFFIYSLVRSALRNTALSATSQDGQNLLHDWAVAGIWGLGSIILAKVIAQPDLSFSPMWVWVFLLTSLGAFNPLAFISLNKA